MRTYIFKTPEELQERIDAYFADRDAKEEPYTVLGLCLWLDVDKKTLINYGNRDEFEPVVKRAKMRVEEYLERALLVGKSSVAGPIFNLKNNFGWKDQTEVTNNVNGSLDVRKVVVNGVKPSGS